MFLPFGLCRRQRHHSRRGHFLPLFHHFSTTVLPLFYNLSTICLPLFYHFSTTRLPLFYHVPTVFLPLSYRVPTTVLKLSYRFPTTFIPCSYHWGVWGPPRSALAWGGARRFLWCGLAVGSAREGEHASERFLFLHEEGE